MTAPVLVGSVSTSNSSVLSTSHSITLPANIQAGEFVLLFGMFHMDQNAGPFTISPPDRYSWGSGPSVNAGPSGASARMLSRALLMFADGTEGGSVVTFTTNLPAVSAIIAVRMDIANGNSLADGWYIDAYDVGTTGYDPPAVAWSDGGPWDGLAIAQIYHIDRDPVFGSFTVPGGYTLLADVVSSGVGFGGGGHDGHARVAVATRTIPNLTSEDPSTWVAGDATGFPSIPPLWLFRQTLGTRNPGPGIDQYVIRGSTQVRGGHKIQRVAKDAF